MSNDNSTRTTAELLDELDEVAGQLATRDAHFNLYHHCGEWTVVVFVRPIADPEVSIRQSAGIDDYGVINAESVDRDDAIATALRVCESVVRSQAVSA